MIEGKTTEPAFIGKYDNFYETGAYIFAVNAMLRFFLPRTKSMQVVVGPAYDDSCSVA